MAASDEDDWSTVSESEPEPEPESEPTPWPPGEAQPCAVCHDLNSYYASIDPVELLRSAETKACLGCGLILDALEKFDVDVSSFSSGLDFISSLSEPTLSVAGEPFCKVSAGSPPPFEHLPEATDVLGHTGSDRTIAQILDWMQECTEKHWQGVGCPPNLDVPLPDRVLDVGLRAGGNEDDQPVVRLAETSGQRGTYACLSHCWGPTPLIRTLRGNYEEHKAGIGFDLLPKTFQDAVKVARALGIPYLWIDSLCIIQDDEDDWQVQASLMASIYQNGRVTISASNSTDSSGGCFTDTSRYISKEISAVDGKDDSSNTRYYARARRYIDHGYSPILGKSWHILGRGWVFQERLLSPRVLHFGHAEMIWECFEALKCECSRCGDADFQHLGFMLGRKRFVDQWTISAAHFPTHLDASPEFWAATWRQIVKTYSRLSLTFGKDIFPAVSGAAKQLQRHRGGGGARYIAGLWEDTLVEDLLWESSDPQQPRPLDKWWHAPTWSWALVSGGPHAHKHYATGVSYEAARFLPEVEHTYVTVDEVSVSPLGPDPTGQLSAAHIIITGPALVAQLDRPYGKDGLHRLRIVSGDDEHDELPLSNFHADYLLSGAGRGFVPTGARLTCLKIVCMANKERSARDTFYLVLYSAGGSTQLFERIGLLQLEDAQASRYAHLENSVTVKIV